MPISQSKSVIRGFKHHPVQSSPSIPGPGDIYSSFRASSTGGWSARQQSPSSRQPSPIRQYSCLGGRTRIVCENPSRTRGFWLQRGYSPSGQFGGSQHYLSPNFIPTGGIPNSNSDGALIDKTISSNQRVSTGNFVGQAFSTNRSLTSTTSNRRRSFRSPFDSTEFITLADFMQHSSDGTKGLDPQCRATYDKLQVPRHHIQQSHHLPRIRTTFPRDSIRRADESVEDKDFRTHISTDVDGAGIWSEGNTVDTRSRKGKHMSLYQAITDWHSENMTNSDIVVQQRHQIAPTLTKPDD